MACPFFVPSRRFETSGWARPPRFPLGDQFAGACHAQPEHIIEPPEAHQREICNCGYARGRCDRFPEDAPGDAIRFSVTDDSSARLALVYVLEKDHVPVLHGLLEYGILEHGTDLNLEAASPIGPVLDRQARSFVESYLSRRARAQAAP